LTDSGKTRINTRTKRIFSILLILLIVLAVACGVVYTIQDEMIFYHVMDSQSRDFLTGRSGFREVQFTAENWPYVDAVIRSCTISLTI